MAEDNWYNGYSTKERDKKFKELKKRIARGETPPATGPCALCGDPDVPVEYHDEDYGEPFIWEAPALLALCRHCHRDKLHKRFWRQCRLARIRRAYSERWLRSGSPGRGDKARVGAVQARTRVRGGFHPQTTSAIFGPNWAGVVHPSTA